MDQSQPNPQQPTQRAGPVGSVNVVERGIISGDNVQFGRLRRRTHLSQSESSGPEEELSLEAGGSYGRSPVLQGLQAEQIWCNRSTYEKAEGNYQRQRTFSGNGPLGSSPRSPNYRASMTFRSKRGQEQNADRQPFTVKSSGTPHQQEIRGRYRTSSETEQGSKGSRGPAPRKRGFSETENKPKRDKYDPSRSGTDFMCGFIVIIDIDDIVLSA